MPLAREPNQELEAALQPIEIDWYEEQEVVGVTPRDQQRFEVQKDNAINALRLARQADQAAKQLQLLLNTIAEWAQGFQGRWNSLILTVQDGSLLLLVVQHKKVCDWQMGESLAKLDMDIANSHDFHLLTFNAMVLPNVSTESLRAFVDERFLLEYANKKRPSRTRRKKPTGDRRVAGHEKTS